MANRNKGEVTLRLDDGREFILVMDFDMRCEVEDLCEKPFMTVAEDAQKGFHRAIRAIFWGSLRRHHPGLSMSDVTNLIEDHGGEIEKALSAAANAASGGEDGDGPRPPGRRRATKTSGASGAKSG